MDVSEELARARDAITVKRVYGEPYERDGVTVIPAAVVMGGAGGGSGEGPAQGAGPPSGSGGGFGLAARPAGAFIIREGRVTWEPAWDMNRIIIGAQIVALALILAARSVRKARAKRA